MKKVIKVLVVVIILIVCFGFWFFYEGFDTVDVQLSEVKPGEVIDESYYLTETVENEKTVKTYSLDSTHGLKPSGVIIGEGAKLGKDGVFVKAEGNIIFNRAPVAIVAGSDFHNGIIELEVNGTPSQKASPFTRMGARGFIGVAFRIKEDLSTYEALYLRPTNGPTDDPVRKNHAVQYVSYPEWEFDRLREEAPEKYEAASPTIAPGEWKKNEN